MKQNNFRISFEKENIDAQILVEKIKQEGWINSSTVIVNCGSDYSSRLCQMVNHRLSHLNKNELYEQLSLEMPPSNMSQIYNPYTRRYEMFDRYLTFWLKDNIDTKSRYLFISSATIRGRNFNKIRTLIKPLLEPSEYRFATVYLEKNSIFQPDYIVETFESAKGNLLFEWENMDNTNRK